MNMAFFYFQNKIYEAYDEKKDAITTIIQK